jgi:hypothetical protein
MQMNGGFFGSMLPQGAIILHAAGWSEYDPWDGRRRCEFVHISPSG